MVGQGVLRECLLDREIEHVLTVGRTATDQQSVKLTGLVHKDFLDFRAIEDQLAGYDACFFCLGVSSVGLSEQDYERVTFEYTVRAATTLARVNPGMTFEYISGMGTDSSEKGRSMWARVKGKTENALMRLPFQGCLRVATRLYTADRRNQIEDRIVPGDLHRARPALSRRKGATAELLNDHRAARTGDDRACKAGCGRADTGSSRDQCARRTEVNVLEDDGNGSGSGSRER